MTRTTLPYTTCETLQPIPPFQFEIHPPALSAIAPESPADLPEPATAAQLGVGIVLTIIVLLLLRPTSKSRITSCLVGVSWLAVGLCLTLLISGTRSLPAIADFAWVYRTPETAILLLEKTQRTARWVAEKVQKPLAHRWAAQLSALHDFYASKGMWQALTSHNMHQAERIADQAGRSEITLPYIEAVYLTQAAHALNANALHAAQIHVKKAQSLQFSAQSEHAANTLQAQMAWQDIKNNELQTAHAHLFAISRSWSHPRHPALIDRLQVGIASNLFQSPSTESLELAIEQSEKLLQRRLDVSQHQGFYIPCNLAVLHEMEATQAMKQGQPYNAVIAFKRSKELVENSPITQELLPDAHYQEGLRQHANMNATQAAIAFEAAYTLAPSRKYACRAAEANRLVALELAGTGEFNEANQTLDRAQRYCASETQHQRYLGEVAFLESLSFMRQGDWHKARARLTDLNQHPEVQERASLFLADIHHALQRQQQIKRATSLGYVPTISGQQCTEFSQKQGGQFNCTAVAFYYGNEQIGRSTDVTGAHLTSVYFGDANNSVSLVDTDENGTFESWRRINYSAEQERVDTDGDDLPDWERNYREGMEIELKPLSGRVSMHIVGGAIAKKGIDTFSQPDLFVEVHHNGHYLGRTETAHNSQFPQLRTLFNFHYKFGHTLELRMFDEEIFAAEYIDTLTINQLPYTNTWISDQSHVALLTYVTPADQPDGRYESNAPEELRTLFADPAFEQDQSPLGNIVRSAQAERSRAEFMTFAAAIAIPEIAVASSLSKAHWVTQVAAAWIGFDVVLHELSPQ